MYLLIKTIIIRRSKDKGFAVPFAIMLGLIMILLATVNIVKSNEEDLTAIGQRGTSKALTAAEAGIAYYQSLINKNRVIAVRNRTDDPGWITNTDTIPDIDFYTTTPANCSANGFSEANGFGSDAVADNATDDWRDVPEGIGQFRLINYTYAPPASANDLGTGTLIVEGRDRDTDQDASVTRLQVQFDVKPGISSGGTGDITDDLNSFDPALWLGSETLTLNTGNNNLTVNGNMIISKIDCQLSTGVQTIANALGNGTAYPRDLLATPSPPDDGTAGYPFRDVVNEIEVANLNDIKNTPLPRNSDEWTLANGGTDQIAYYLIKGDLTLTDGESIEVSNGAKVILFVQGNISLTGDVNLNQNISSNTSDRLEIYGNVTDAALPQGYKFGCATTCASPTITFAGADTKKINIKAFIHAPAATVTTSGSDDPTVNISGAMWVDGWNDTSSDSKKITITPDDRYKEYTSIGIRNGASNLTIKPFISSPRNWQTQEVD
ncbi:MAG: hypothetical protein Kow0049_18890 [Stanieria sp.]